MAVNEIIIGVDGSAYSLRAVEWAAAEAERRNAALRILHAIPSWLFETSVEPRVRQVREWMRNSGQEVIDEAAAKARGRAPGVTVSGELVPGGPSRALVEAAEGALMVVVGSHGAGSLTGLLLGSVALQVASHAPCPAVVVRQAERDAAHDVVVGVDGSAGSQAALGFGFEEAALRKVRLRAVHAWTHPASAGPGDMQPLVFDPDLVGAEEGRVLAESLAGWQERFPDVEVVRDVVRGRPSRVLTAASSGADLLVVGTRGRGGFAGLVLGSVSHAMLHHVRCPLAVVPNPHR
jgi:nucleotide-binding universal stress UspA family protein